MSGLSPNMRPHLWSALTNAPLGFHPSKYLATAGEGEPSAAAHARSVQRHYLVWLERGAARPTAAHHHAWVDLLTCVHSANAADRATPAKQQDAAETAAATTGGYTPTAPGEPIAQRASRSRSVAVRPPPSQVRSLRKASEDTHSSGSGNEDFTSAQSNIRLRDLLQLAWAYKEGSYAGPVPKEILQVTRVITALLSLVQSRCAPVTPASQGSTSGDQNASHDGGHVYRVTGEVKYFPQLRWVTAALLGVVNEEQVSERCYGLAVFCCEPHSSCWVSFFFLGLLVSTVALHSRTAATGIWSTGSCIEGECCPHMLRLLALTQSQTITAAGSWVPNPPSPEAANP